MSWQVWSFLVLGLVLLGGFAWYERSRPPSQVVALVAALAALAVAGRLAFAVLPNVVATTDIVLFAGYAIGPAPGFAVGALAGLVSNFWLGQGPWTPWQMAGWGLCGLLGALLAWRGRRLGRVGLALACAFAGVAYGALLNFSLMATYGGEFSLARFAALEARAVPFDLAHAIGNFTLAIVAGPAMVRRRARNRQRAAGGRAAERPARGAAAGLASGPGAAAVLLTVALAAIAMPPAEARAADTAAAVRWLERAQRPDGGFSYSGSGRSSVAITGWAMLGLEAAGRSPLAVHEGGPSPVGFLRGEVAKTGSTGDLARTILALRGAGVGVRSFGGRDLVAALRGRRRPDGSYEGWPNATAFAVLALRSAGVRRQRRSLGWLRRAQNPDGGWGVVAGGPSDPDSTGAVLQAVSGRRSVRRGAGYLRRAQAPGGGFRLAGSGPVNSQSTAWAVQGLIAAGRRPAGLRRGGRSPLDYLDARQAADGHFGYSRRSDQTPVWVTAQALVAVAGQAFPLPPVSSPQPDGAAGAGRASPGTTAAPGPGPGRGASGARGAGGGGGGGARGAGGGGGSPPATGPGGSNPAPGSGGVTGSGGPADPGAGTPAPSPARRGAGRSSARPAPGSAPAGPGADAPDPAGPVPGSGSQPLAGLALGLVVGLAGGGAAWAVSRRRSGRPG